MARWFSLSNACVSNCQGGGRLYQELGEESRFGGKRRVRRFSASKETAKPQLPRSRRRLSPSFVRVISFSFHFLRGGNLRNHKTNCERFCFIYFAALQFSHFVFSFSSFPATWMCTSIIIITEYQLMGVRTYSIHLNNGILSQRRKLWSSFSY